MTVHSGKGQHDHADRLKRSTSSSGNGRWLFGQYLEGQQAAASSASGGNSQAQFVREIRRQPANAYGASEAAALGAAPGEECCACRPGPPGPVIFKYKN